VKIVPYTPDRFSLVAGVAATAPGARSLGHRPFVDYYYATRDWCRLYLAIDRDERVAAVMGLEQLRFEYRGRPMVLGCASNFVALRAGAGGPLFLHWVRSSEYACVFGGSPDTHRIVQSQRWTYFHGIRVLRLNRPLLARPGEAPWRAAAKTLLRAVRPGVDIARRAAGAPGEVTVVEEAAIGPDMVPASTGFAFRLAPTVEYLNWRYDPALSFVRYRLYRIVRDGTRGYVIVNERPDRIMVAQADADDPGTLAAGILAAVGCVAASGRRRREVVLSCAHPRMTATFRDVGFRADSEERPLAIGSVRRPVDLAPDTSAWLINLDWIDNGLRAPFLDQAASAP